MLGTAFLSRWRFQIPRKYRKFSMIVTVPYRLTTTLQIIENVGSSVYPQGKRNRTKLLLWESSVKSISLISEHCMGALALAPTGLRCWLERSRGFCGQNLLSE